jgi:hypothetical protein
VASDIAQHFHELLYEGCVNLAERPERTSTVPTDALQVIEQAYKLHALTVSGPPIPFDVAVALAAGQFVTRACWFVLNHDEPESVITEELKMPHRPSTAAYHLNADLFFRYLPQIHRRARAINPEDRLTVLLEETMRIWPLSGVLGAAVAGPLTNINFDNHPGLQLLYAERLATHEKPDWIPADGPTRAFVELVWHQAGKPQPCMPAET